MNTGYSLFIGSALLVLLVGCGSSDDKGGGSSSISSISSEKPLITDNTDAYPEIQLSEGTASIFLGLIFDEIESPLEEATFGPSTFGGLDNISADCPNGGSFSANSNTVTFNECWFESIQFSGGVTIETLAIEGEGIELAEGELFSSHLEKDAYFKLKTTHNPIYLMTEGLESEISGEATHSYRLKANNGGAEGVLAYKDYRVVAKIDELLAVQDYSDYDVAQTKSHTLDESLGYITLDLNGDASIRTSILDLKGRYEYTIETIISFGLNDGIYQGAAKITSGAAVMDVVHLDHKTYSLMLDEDGDGVVDFTDTFTMDFVNTISASF